MGDIVAALFLSPFRLHRLTHPLHASAADVDGVHSPCRGGNEQLLQERRANRASSDGSMAGVSA